MLLYFLITTHHLRIYSLVCAVAVNCCCHVHLAYAVTPRSNKVPLVGYGYNLYKFLSSIFSSIEFVFIFSAQIIVNSVVADLRFMSTLCNGNEISRLFHTRFLC